MKKLIVVAACMLASAAAYAQGTIHFANLGGGVNAPISDADGTKLAGAAFEAQLYAGPSSSSLAAVGAPVAFSTSGFFLGSDTAVPTVAVGGTAVAQVKVWRVVDGASYEVASKVTGAHVGASTPLTGIGPLGGGGPPPLPGAFLTGMTSFSLTIVPEPSTIALGILGAGALLLRRRK